MYRKTDVSHLKWTCFFGGKNFIRNNLGDGLMRRLFLAAAFAAVFSAPALAQGSSAWDIDPNHGKAQFTVRHLGISNVQGEFTRVTGVLVIDEQDITKSSVTATIDTTSLDTGNADRDKDVKSGPDFLDVEKFPTMTFQSKSVSRGSDGKLLVTGALTLHGVTKDVTFHVDGPSEQIKDPWGKQRRGASATATIHRSEFGVTKYPGVIGEDLAIVLDVELVKK
jgi:polyisoprenoid-binding protein YceI